MKKAKPLEEVRRKKRDSWYGYSDKDFQKWWHRKGKGEFGGRDIIDAQQAKEIYEYWESIGKPTEK